MKAIRVTYIAKADYVAHNQENIQKVMADLQRLNHAGINYHACLGADGRTFTHTAFFNSEGDEKILLGLPAFVHFQEQLKAKGLDTPPKSEQLSLVGSSKELFN
jgi:hypothetical protein